MMRELTEDDFRLFPPKDPGSEVRAIFDGHDFHAVLMTDGEVAGMYFDESLPGLLDKIVSVVDMSRHEQVTAAVRQLQRDAMQARLNEIMAGGTDTRTRELLRSLAA